MPVIEERLEPHCRLCLRIMDESLLTKHHLLPRSKGGTSDDVELLCGMCHGMVHASFENRTLAREFRTLHDLRRAPELQEFLKWVRKQPATRRTRNRQRNDKR